MTLRASNRGVRTPSKEPKLHWLGLQREFVHDTYKLRKKLPEPTVCNRCGAVFHKGHWSWAVRPARAHESICPACHRLADNYPAGILQMSGPFLKTHREELLNAIRHQEREAKREHPLSRLIGVKDTKAGLVVTTTDMHLPRRIGEALWHAYHGELKLHYADDARLLRVTWKR